MPSFIHYINCRYIEGQIITTVIFVNLLLITYLNIRYPIKYIINIMVFINQLSNIILLLFLNNTCFNITFNNYLNCQDNNKFVLIVKTYFVDLKTSAITLFLMSKKYVIN